MSSSAWRRCVAVLLAVLLVATAGAGVASAQDASTTSGDGDGELLDVSGWTAVGVLLAGTVVLMASIELLIKSLVRTAVRFGVSTFLLAVIFSGWEFDNVAFGVATGFRELQNVAFGLAIGNAISIFGLTLAVGVLLFPFTTDVPREYLVLTLATPLLLVPILVSGSLTPALGAVLVAAYVLVFAYIARNERRLRGSFMEADEVRQATTPADGRGDAARRLPRRLRRLTWTDWFWPLLLVASTGGIVVGAEVSSAGVEGTLETWELSGTFVGVTLVTVLYTVDDLLLIVEPLRLGHEDVAVGGVLGSLLFFVTANMGIIGLVGEIRFRPETVLFHYPALLAFVALSTYFLWRGRLTRKHGALLFGMYLLYLLVNVQFFATATAEL